MAIVRTKGLSFPLQLTSGAHTLVEGVDLIKDSIKIILSWPLYTREYVDDFGSRIFEVLEEPNDDILKTLIRKFTIDALQRWEYRIELLDFNIERTAPEKIAVDLIFRVRELNIEDSLSYDLYINQGI